MKNFLNKQREFVALFGYVLLIGGLVYLVILPLIGKIDEIADQIQQEDMKQESVQLHIQQLPKIQKQYQALQSSNDLAGVLLDENRAVVLIEKLEKLAETTNNKITITVQEKVEAPVKKTTKAAAQDSKTLMEDLPNANYLQMKINLIGGYDAVVDFIDQLEKFEYYADVVAIQIKKYDESTESKQSISNPGMFGGAPIVTSNGAVKLDKQATDALAASLDTVFYTN